MSYRPGVRLVAAFFPLAAVLVASSSAHAERLVTKDAVGDVVSLVPSDPPENEEPEFVPAPEHTAVDITRTVVDHRSERLRVTVSYQDLRRDFQHYQFVGVHTRDAKFRLLLARRGGPASVVLMRGENALECEGLEASVDQSPDRIAISLPTSCLDSPRWVRIGVGSEGIGQDTIAEDGDYEIFGDDANISGALTPADAKVTLGPKVHRD